MNASSVLPGLAWLPKLSQGPAETRAVWGPPSRPWAIVAFESDHSHVRINYVQVASGAGARAEDFVADALRAAGISRATTVDSSIVTNTTILRLIDEGKVALVERIVQTKADSLANAMGAALCSTELVGDQASGWIVRVTLSYR